MREYILRIENITKRFGGVSAIDNLSLKIENGTITSLIGPNGAGKTTLFNLISGLLQPDEGEIFLKNRTLTGNPPHVVTALGIGRTFQNIRLFNQSTIIENVIVGMYYRQTGSPIKGFLNFRGESSEFRKLRERAEKLLSIVGLGHRLDFAVSILPYGEKRLLEIARALAGEPSFLMLDEPSAGMNENEASRLKELIFNLKKDGKTIFVIEHNVRMIMDISDIVAVINFGSKIAEGTPKEVQANEQVISAYLGTTG